MNKTFSKKMPIVGITNLYKHYLYSQLLMDGTLPRYVCLDINHINF